jgi:hypothetical protein
MSRFFWVGSIFTIACVGLLMLPLTASQAVCACTALLIYAFMYVAETFYERKSDVHIQVVHQEPPAAQRRGWGPN